MTIKGSLFIWIPIIIFILYQIGINITQEAINIILFITGFTIALQHLFAIILFFVEQCWENDINHNYSVNIFDYSYKYSIINLLVIMTKFLNKHLTIKL
jgi:hypothetical protein